MPNPLNQKASIIYKGIVGNQYQLAIYDTLCQLLFSGEILSAEQTTCKLEIKRQVDFAIKIGDKHEFLVTKNFTMTH